MKINHFIPFLCCFLLIACVEISNETKVLPTPQLTEKGFQFFDIDSDDEFIKEASLELISKGFTDEMANLGRVLFYDTRLSITNNISCGSCHLQSRAFSDGLKHSEGFRGDFTRRNSMAISNLINNTGFFWDRRVWNIENQVLMPVMDHIEMGIESEEQLVNKLETEDYYIELFEKAYGSNEISIEKISQSLASFTLSLMSTKSDFDREKLNAQQLAGMELFLEHNCSSCHSDPVKTSQWAPSSANIGLDYSYDDNGIYEWSGSENDKGKFIVPSLRNVALTAPYMHDGRFETLREVVDHYSDNIKLHENLSWHFQTYSDIGVSPLRMNLTEIEKENLVAFMESFTDEAFIQDPKFSNPFQ